MNDTLALLTVSDLWDARNALERRAEMERRLGRPYGPVSGLGVSTDLALFAIRRELAERRRS